MLKFQKHNRILKKLEFTKVFDAKEKVVCRQLVVYGDISQNSNRLGLVVSKKVGGAIARNKVKRRLRESFRHTLPNMPHSPGIDIVVIARHTAASATFLELSDSLENCIRRLNKKLENRAQANKTEQES